MINRGRRVQVVEHQIDVAVVVQIAGGHAVGNPLEIKLPVGTGRLELTIAPVAEGRIARAPARVQLHGTLELILGQAATGVLDLRMAVLIHHVEFEAVGEQQVFVTVEVHIEEQGGPGPVGSGQTRHPSHLGVVATGPAQEEGVAVELGTALGQFQLGQGGAIPDQLGHPGPVFPGQHVHHEEVVVTVPIDVGKIHAHGRAAGVAQFHRVQLPELTPTLIDPDAIGRRVVIADIQIRGSIAIDIAEHHRQTPIPIGRYRLSLRIRKRAGLVLDSPEPALPLIEVQPVYLGQLAHLAVGQRLEAALPFRGPGRFAVDLGNFPTIALAGECEPGGGVGQPHHVDEVRAVQIQIAIAIDVGQRHRGRRGCRGQARVLLFSKGTAAVIEEKPGSHADAIDQQVEIPVAIDIHQSGRGGTLVGTSDLRQVHGFKTPLTPVAEQPIRPLQIAQIHIGPTVAIHIADGHAGPVVGHGIGQIQVARHRVGEDEPNLLWNHRMEPHRAVRGRGKLTNRGSDRYGLGRQVGSESISPTKKQADKQCPHRQKDGIDGALAADRERCWKESSHAVELRAICLGTSEMTTPRTSRKKESAPCQARP